MNICSECGKETKNPKYCSSSCSVKQTARLRTKNRPMGECKTCNGSVISSQTYCKSCKPKHNISHRKTGLDKCLICGVLKTTENTRNNKNTTSGFDTYCKNCLSQLGALQARRVKQNRVDYKGGCCEICGYNKCVSALQFHHRDPTTKEFGIAALNTTGDNPKIREELDKCALLCANCHYEEHVKHYIFDESVIEYEYKLYLRKNKLL